MRNENTATITFNMEPKLKEKIEKHATAHGVGVSAWLREVLALATQNGSKKKAAR